MTLSKSTLALILSLCFLTVTLAQWGPPPSGQGASPPGLGDGQQGGQSTIAKYTECSKSFGNIATFLVSSGGNFTTSSISSMMSFSNNLTYFMKQCASLFLPPGVVPNITSFSVLSCLDYVGQVNTQVQDFKNLMANLASLGPQALMSASSVLSIFQDLQNLATLLPMGVSLCTSSTSSSNGNRILLEKEPGKFQEMLCLDKYLDIIPDILQFYSNFQSDDKDWPQTQVLLAKLSPVFEGCDNEMYNYVHKTLLIMNVTSCADQILIIFNKIKEFVETLETGDETMYDALEGLQQNVIHCGDMFLEQCNIDGVFDRVPQVETMLQNRQCIEELYGVAKYYTELESHIENPMAVFYNILQMFRHADMTYAYCVIE